MPKLGWQGSTALQISSQRIKQHVRAGNNGSHRRNEAAPLGQVKNQWQASYKPRPSDVTGFDRDRDRLQDQKCGYIWRYRSRPARLVCTCMAINECTIELLLTSLHPGSVAPVYVKLSAYRIGVGPAVQKQRANIFDIASYIRSKRKCMAPPWQTVWHRQLDRGWGGDVVVLVIASFVLEAVRQACAVVR
jgi:hypothetical protein